MADPEILSSAPNPGAPDRDPGQSQRVADVLLALETAPAVGFMLLATTVHDASGARAVVMMRLADRTFRLDPDDTRLVARCVGFEDQRRATGLLVSLLQSAACDGEAMEARFNRPATATAVVIPQDHIPPELINPRTGDPERLRAHHEGR